MLSQIKISLPAFFKDLTSTFIEKLFDEDKKEWFKRSDLGRYLGIAKIKNNTISSQLTPLRKEIKAANELARPPPHSPWKR